MTRMSTAIDRYQERMSHVSHELPVIEYALCRDSTYCCPSESDLAPALSNRNSDLTSWGTVSDRLHPGLPFVVKNGCGYFISDAICDLAPALSNRNSKLTSWGTVSDRPQSG